MSSLSAARNCIDLQDAPQLEILQQLFQFFTHPIPHRAESTRVSHGEFFTHPIPHRAESTRVSHGARSSVTAGPDRKDHNGRPRARPPAAVSVDTPAPGATVAAGQA